MDLAAKSCVVQAPRKTIAIVANLHRPTDILASGMSHVTNDRKVLSRIRRIKGQIEGLERAVLQGEDCYKVLQQTAAARGALNGLVTELIESHLRFHTISKRPNRNGARELDQVMTVIRSYLG